jgi:hypothetical protein
VLECLGVTADGVRASVIRIDGSNEALTSGSTPFRADAMKMLVRAPRESLSTGHYRIGPEHLLLALLPDDDGVAVRILRELSADPDVIRSRVPRRSSIDGRELAEDAAKLVLSRYKEQVEHRDENAEDDPEDMLFTMDEHGGELMRGEECLLPVAGGPDGVEMRGDECLLAVTGGPDGVEVRFGHRYLLVLIPGDETTTVEVKRATTGALVATASAAGREVEDLATELEGIYRGLPSRDDATT